MNKISQGGLILIGAMLFTTPMAAQLLESIITKKDCFTSVSVPDANWNGSSLLVENNTANSSIILSLIYFDLSSIPQNALITEAHLHLYCTSNPSRITLGIGRLAGNSWTETGVTWKNQPDFSTPPSLKFFGGTNPDSWNAYNVTEFVETWHDNTYFNNGFQLFTQSNATGAIFSDRESGNNRTPFLEVTYQVPPIKTTLDTPANGSTGVPTDISLCWHKTSNADSCRLQVSTTSTFSSTIFDQAGISGTSTDAPSFANNITYYWHVNATNAAGTGPYSSIWSFKTTPLQPLPPSLDSPADGATCVSRSPTLNWNSSTGAVFYQLQVSLNSSFTNIIYDQSVITNTSKSISDISYNITYYWRVNARNAGGTSNWSSDWSFTTTAATPPKPTLASPLNTITGVSVNPTLSWNVAENAEFYRLQVSTEPSFTNIPIDQEDITGTSFAISALEPEFTYYWRVYARNNCGAISLASTDWSFTTESTISVEQTSNKVPKYFRLGQNYPNPFNPTTTIEFDLPNTGFATLKVYDSIGNEIVILISEILQAGKYKTMFNTNSLASGLYLYRFQSGSFTLTKKMLFIK